MSRAEAAAKALAPPYLSVVVAARNDDHGGGFLRRMQLFVDNLAAQSEHHGLETELVVVEWNPPSKRAPLVEAISWPATQRCRVRILEVPPALHALHAHADRLPLFQMMAKNVGIRRSRGRFVLATNADVLLSDGLVRSLAERGLDPSCVYRVDRLDVSADVPTCATTREQLAACAERVVRVNLREKTVDLRSGATLTIYPPAKRHRRISRSTEFVRVMGGELERSLGRVVLAPGRAEGRRVSAPARAARAECTRLRLRFSMLRADWLLRSGGLHTNACGDFTLMSHELWQQLRGYDELPVSAWHLDSMLLHRARALGASERYLPHPLYHVEHGRPAESGVPRLSFDDLRTFVLDLDRARRPIVANGEHWGLAEHALAETAIGGAGGRRPARAAVKLVGR